MAPLDISRADTTLSVAGPVVLESGDPNNLKIINDLSADDTQAAWTQDGDNQSTPLTSVTVAPDASVMMLDAQDGTRYTVRRLLDDDGNWASELKMPVPAESLEEMHDGGLIVDPNESLWAALDPNTGELQELIYSSPSGVYARAQGGWFRYDDDDDSLDGLESIDVDPSILDVFDEADSKGTQLTRDDVLKFSTENSDVPDAPDDSSDTPDVEDDNSGDSSESE